LVIVTVVGAVVVHLESKIRRQFLVDGHEDVTELREMLRGIVENVVVLSPSPKVDMKFPRDNQLHEVHWNDPEAAAEFQKILDHRGIVLNEPIGALAHLGLARAYAMQGDTAKAHAAYQDFLTLWKDADADIPIFIAAKAEYAKLQ
jgi:hypothetical protein